MPEKLLIRLLALWVRLTDTKKEKWLSAKKAQFNQETITTSKTKGQWPRKYGMDITNWNRTKVADSSLYTARVL